MGGFFIQKDRSTWVLRMIRQYRELLALSQRLFEEHQRIEFLLDEYRLSQLGVNKADHDTN